MVTMTPRIGIIHSRIMPHNIRSILYSILIATNPQEGKGRRETNNLGTETEVIPTMPTREEDRQGKNRHPIVDWRL